MLRSVLVLFVVLSAAPPAPAQESELDKALREAEAKRPAPAPEIGPFSRGAGAVRLMDISMDSLVAAGGSNQRDGEISNLQGGGHDPRKRGFTVQNIELSLAAAVDPYLTAEAHLIYFLDPTEGESVFELEEVFATTTALPGGLQLEMGHFFTEFGRINAQHPHQWDFQDQPIVNSRLFGPDGLRGPGFRLAWLTPLPFFAELHVGLQNANGETAASFFASEEFFEERAIGGRQFVEQDVRSFSDLLHLVRANASFDIAADLTAVVGLSGLFGPNATGRGGDTRIYGIDLRLKWRPAKNFRGWPFVVWQTEFMRRRYDAAAQDFDPNEIPGDGDDFSVGRDSLRDQGLYTYVLYGFSHGWVAGLRFEMAGSGGDTIDPATGAAATDTDPFRDRRSRVSAMIGWHPTEFSRMRLQYNYDRAEHLDEDPLIDDGVGHSLWLGVEFFFGAHAAHPY